MTDSKAAMPICSTFSNSGGSFAICISRWEYEVGMRVIRKKIYAAEELKVCSGKE